MKLTKLPVIALCLIAVLTACSHEDPNSPVYKRKQVFKEMLRTSQSMRDMLRGNADWNASKFAADTARLQQLSTQPWPLFVPASKDDSTRTDAKPAVWEKPQDFHAAQQKLQEQLQTLQQAAASNNPVQIRPQFAAMEDSCASCHKAFRAF